MKKTLMAAAALASAALLITGCASGGSGGGGGGGGGDASLLIGTTDKVTFIDPAGSYDNGSFAVMNQNYPFLLVVVDGGIDALRQRQRGGIPTLFVEELPDLAHEAGELVGRVRPGAGVAIGVPDRAPQGIGMLPAEPERHVRLLHGLGPHAGALQLVELTSEVRHRLGPQGL